MKTKKNDIFYGFRKTFEYHLRLTITHFHFLFITAVIFHFFIVQFDIDNLKSWQKVIVDGQEYIKLENGKYIEVQKSNEIKDSMKRKKISMRLNLNSKIKKRSADLESILEQELKKATKPKKLKIEKRKGMAQGKRIKKKQIGLFNVPNFMQEKLNTQVNKRLSLDLGKIRKIVYQRNNQYQKCYERSLIRDEFIQGLVKIEVLVAGKEVKKSLIDFQGAGNKSAIKLLQDCLRSNLARLKFTPELQNEVIRFNLFFKS